MVILEVLRKRRRVFDKLRSDDRSKGIDMIKNHTG